MDSIAQDMIVRALHLYYKYWHPRGYETYESPLRVLSLTLQIGKQNWKLLSAMRPSCRTHGQRLRQGYTLSRRSSSHTAIDAGVSTLMLDYSPIISCISFWISLYGRGCPLHLLVRQMLGRFVGPFVSKLKPGYKMVRA